jgi:hypothetical protein
MDLVGRALLREAKEPSGLPSLPFSLFHFLASARADIDGECARADIDE